MLVVDEVCLLEGFLMSLDSVHHSPAWAEYYKNAMTIKVRLEAAAVTAMAVLPPGPIRTRT